MALSLALILIAAFFINEILTKLKIPGLLGMILLGVILGPYGYNKIDENLLAISGDLRLIALIIILLRAGFGIKKAELNAVRREVVKMSCIPGILEGFTVALASMKLLDFTFIQGGILGFIIAAVSPAVIVPKMLEFQSLKRGTEKKIPTIILAGASVDDVFAITIFTSFLALYGGKSVNILRNILSIPLSIFLGIGIGGGIGFILVKFFKWYRMRDTKKVILLLALAILFHGMEKFISKNYHLEIASLLGIMTIGFVILEMLPNVGSRLSLKFNKAWVFAEIILFVLVGAQVNIGVALDSGMVGIMILFLGLLARSFGVYISLLGTDLNLKEKIFTMVAYMPKATVQAAIGAIPLSAGVASGEIILAIAVLAILLTAPLGAASIDYFGKRFL
ncbi:MAG: cation:proton antiporter [Fusobacteriaceae bacterium]